MTAEDAAAFVLRHDIDACLWSPSTGDEWTLNHKGTLLAFGYVQVSKQQRKFSICSSNLSYSVICKRAQHVFIYRQNREIMSGELWNRQSGLRIDMIAEQQVINIGDQEIINIYASERFLYLLNETKLFVFKIAT